MKNKAVIAGRCFPFCTRKCIFFMRFRVQKHREVFADGKKASLNHGFGRFADDNPVVVARRCRESPAFKQRIADKAADRINLHIGSSKKIREDL